MKQYLLTMAVAFSISWNVQAQDSIFSRLENQTWFDDNSFAGSSMVFYETENGNLKLIYQRHGSGVPVIASSIYDVVIRDYTVHLINGLDLKTSEQRDGFELVYDQNNHFLMGEGKPIKALLSIAVLNTWRKHAPLWNQIDLEQLANVSIGKNEIYAEDVLLKVEIEPQELKDEDLRPLYPK